MIKFLNDCVDTQIVVFINTSIYMKKWLIEEVIKSVNSYLCINPIILVEYTDNAIVHTMKKGSIVTNFKTGTQLYQPSPFNKIKNIKRPIKLINITTSLFNNHFGIDDFECINRCVEKLNITKMTTLISRCNDEIIDPVLIDKGTVIYDNPKNILSSFKDCLISYNLETIENKTYFIINRKCITYNKIDDFGINPLLNRLLRMLKSGYIDERFIRCNDNYKVLDMVNVNKKNLPYIIILFYFLYSGNITEKQISVSYNIYDVYNFVKESPRNNLILDEAELEKILSTSDNCVEKSVVLAKTPRFNMKDFKNILLDEINKNVIPLYKSDIFQGIIKLKLPENEIKRCILLNGINVNDIKTIRKLIIDSMEIEHNRFKLYELLERYYEKVFQAMHIVYSINTKARPCRTLSYVYNFFEFYGMKTAREIAEFLFGGNMFSMLRSILNKLIVYNILYYKNANGQYDVEFKYI